MPGRGLKYGLPAVKTIKAAVKRTRSQMAAVGNLSAAGSRHRGAPFGNKNAAKGIVGARAYQQAQARGTDSRARAMAAAQRKTVPLRLPKNEQSPFAAPTIV